MPVAGSSLAGTDLSGIDGVGRAVHAEAVEYEAASSRPLRVLIALNACLQGLFCSASRSFHSSLIGANDERPSSKRCSRSLDPADEGRDFSLQLR